MKLVQCMFILSLISILGLAFFISEHIVQEAREVPHIRLNNHAINHNNGKMHNSVNRSSFGSRQATDLNQSQGYMHQTIPSKSFSRAVCLVH